MDNGNCLGDGENRKNCILVNKKKLNHFALKAKVYLVALEVAWEQFDYLKNY